MNPRRSFVQILLRGGLLAVLCCCSCATGPTVDSELARALEDQFVQYLFATRPEEAYQIDRPMESGTAALVLRSAERGNPYAQQLAGLHFGWGVGVPRDEARAREWMAAAAENGNPVAQLGLGVHLLYSGGPDADGISKARAWLGKAADAGVSDAYVALSEAALLAGTDLDVATNEAIRCLEKAVEGSARWEPRLAMARKGIFIYHAPPTGEDRPKATEAGGRDDGTDQDPLSSDAMLSDALLCNLSVDLSVPGGNQERKVATALRLSEMASALAPTNVPVRVERTLVELIASPKDRPSAGAALRALRSVARSAGDESLLSHAAAEALRIARDGDYPEEARGTALLVLEEIVRGDEAPDAGAAPMADRPAGRPGRAELREAAEQIDRDADEWSLRLLARAVLSRSGSNPEGPKPPAPVGRIVIFGSEGHPDQPPPL